MAKRYLESQLWDKSWFRKLHPKLKLFYYYMISKCNHAGVWSDVDLELAEFQIGMTIDEKEILKELKDHIHVIKANVWYIHKFVKFQYGELNPNVRAHASVIKILKENKLKVSKGLVKGLPHLKDKDQYKYKDKVKNKEKENNVEFDEILDIKQDENKFEIRRIKFINELNKEFHKKYTKELRRAFFEYWTEPNKSKTKMRFELEKTWDTGRRLARWANNSFNKQQDIRSYDSDVELKKTEKLKEQMEQVAKDAADPEEVKKILGV